MRAGDAPPGWYTTPIGRLVRVVGPSDQAGYAWAEDVAGRRIELPHAVEVTPAAAPAAETELVPVLPRGTCGCCGWSGDLVRRDRTSGAVWVLPRHARGEELCQGTARTPAESELLALPEADAPSLWGVAKTTADRAAVVRATSDVAWLEVAALEDGLQAKLRLELQTQRDVLDRVRALAGDGPGLRRARRWSAARARPGVLAAIERLLTEANAAEQARRQAEAKTQAQRAAFRRAAGVAPPRGLYPMPAEPTGPDPVRAVLARDAAGLAPSLVQGELEPLDEEAARQLDEFGACPLTGLDWTTERLAVAVVWGRPLTAAGVLACSRRLSRAAVDPTPWVRRLDPETLSLVVYAAAGRVAEMADPPAQARQIRQVAFAALAPLAPESAGALAVRALRSLWAAGVRATLTLETE